MPSKKKPVPVSVAEPVVSNDDQLRAALSEWFDRWRMSLNIEAAAQMERMLSGHKS